MHERNKICLLFEYAWMVAELNAKIPTGTNTINFHSDGFEIRFDYDSFSNKTIVAISHRVSIKLEESDLAMQMGF